MGAKGCVLQIVDRAGRRSPPWVVLEVNMRINCCVLLPVGARGREAHRIRNLRGHKKCIKRWILRIKYFGHSCIYDISAKSRYAYAMWQSVAMASLGLLLSHCVTFSEWANHTNTHTQTSATFQLRTKRICSLVVSCSALLCSA